VIGIVEQNLGTGLAHVRGDDPLHAGFGSNGHEGGGIKVTVRRAHAAASSLCATAFGEYGKLDGCWRGHFDLTFTYIQLTEAGVRDRGAMLCSCSC
jgi:hypothetical protein